MRNNTASSVTNFFVEWCLRVSNFLLRLAQNKNTKLVDFLTLCNEEWPKARLTIELHTSGAGLCFCLEDEYGKQIIGLVKNVFDANSEYTALDIFTQVKQSVIERENYGLY